MIACLLPNWAALLALLFVFIAGIVAGRSEGWM